MGISCRPLSGQTELFPDVVVNELLEPNLVGRPFPEGNLRDGVTGGVEPLHRLPERGGLFGRGLELDRQRQIHGSIITQIYQYKGEKPE